ncbi:MAG: zinc ribbon domain-containing protein, partial [Chloroflexi bacterium]|nr:zinc ribbon domain-containing protein [Chloroflexota bacterium]
MTAPNVCPKCGAPVSETGSRFCMACGTPLTPAAPLPQTPQTPVPVPEAAQPRPDIRPVKAPVGDKRPPSPPPVVKPRTGWRIISLRTVFGVFDLIAIVVAIVVLAYLRFKPTVAQCPPLTVPSSHTVA